jgi:hypothetical protein
MITDTLERCNYITKDLAMTEIRTCDLQPISESNNAWFKHIYSTKHLTSEQYLQSTFWDWTESYKAYKCPLPVIIIYNNKVHGIIIHNG